MTITEFLLARIEEDERAAGSLKSDWEKYPPSVCDVAQVGYLDAGDPDRVLAECAAKRRIVEQARAYSPESEYGDAEGWALVDVMRALATVHADHPDFLEEWRA